MQQNRRYVINLTEDEFRRLIREAVADLLVQQPPDTATSELITMKEVAVLFKVSLVTIHKWRKFNVLPPAIKKGGRVYFQRSQIINSTNKINHETR